MKELNIRIRKTGMTRKEFCDKIKSLRGRYSTLSSYLNGYTTMPVNIMEDIAKLLYKVENGKA